MKFELLCDWMVVCVVSVESVAASFYIECTKYTFSTFSYKEFKNTQSVLLFCRVCYDMNGRIVRFESRGMPEGFPSSCLGEKAAQGDALVCNFARVIEKRWSCVEDSLGG